MLVAPARGDVDRKQATGVFCEPGRFVGAAGWEREPSGTPSDGPASPVVSRHVLGTASVAGGRPALCLGLNHTTPKGFKSEILTIYYPSHPPTHVSTYVYALSLLKFKANEQVRFLNHFP